MKMYLATEQQLRDIFRRGANIDPGESMVKLESAVMDFVLPSLEEGPEDAGLKYWESANNILWNEVKRLENLLEQIYNARREDVLAFISKESNLLEERDNARDLARELLRKLESEHRYIVEDVASEAEGIQSLDTMASHRIRKQTCSVCALIERSKKETTK